MDADHYPAEEIESIFGIKMETRAVDYSRPLPTGVLVFNAWMGLYKSFCELRLMDFDEEAQGGHRALEQAVKRTRQEFSEEIVQAMLAGDLPGWFQTQVGALPQRQLWNDQ